MANTKSAAKAARQSIKKQARNKSVMSALRTQVRKAREAITNGNNAAIEAELKKAMAIIDKAASKGTIHARNASRKIARLSHAAHAAVKGAKA